MVASTVAWAMTSLVLISRISKLSEVIINASGTVTTVWSPALTFFPAKSYVALIRKVAHCAKSQFRFPPSLFDTLTIVMVSANLPVTETAGVVSSADALWEANVKSAVNKNSKNEKIPNFFPFLFIVLSSFLIKLMVKITSPVYFITFNS